MAFEFSPLGKTNPASFRKEAFLVPEETVERGQKVAIHQYPNSNKMFAEPLGKIPPDIDLVGIIYGEFYIEHRRSLELALEEDGPGELVHPIYGPIQVQPGEFTVKSNQKRIGEFIFSMKFYVSEAVEPNPLPATGITVTALADIARNDLLNAVEDGYELPFDSNVLSNVVDTMLSALNTVNNAIDDVVGPIESFAAATSTAIAKFRNGIYNIMQTASGLKDNLTNVYNSFVQLSLDPATLAAAWDNLLDFKGPDKPDQSTVQRINQSNNQDIIVEQNQYIGLIGGYESAANTNFNTIDELQDRINFLDNKFNEFFESNIDGILVNDSVLRASIISLKVTARIALDAQKAKIWKIIGIDPGKISMSLTAYRYYGSLDNINDLIELNPEVSVSYFDELIEAIEK